MTDANRRAEIAELRLRLEEAEETIRAIRSGAVDAVVVEEPHGPRVYTLQTADRPYRLLVEEMQQGAVTLSNDGSIAYCNRRFADLVGRPLERLMGIAFRDFIPIDAQTFYENLLQQGRAGFSQGESHVRTADGALVPVFLTLNALPPDCGAAVGLLVTDLTTQRHHEKLNALLEALKESDHHKNEFLAMLAHELRNPLAPLRSALQILRRTEGNGEAVRSASEMMERQIGQLVRLVDDLLDVSRISRGKIELRRERVELAPVIHNAIETIRAVIESARHELTVILPPQPLYLHADAARLIQVFGNLLNNSSKYSEPQGHISLTAERQGNDAVVSVKDAGVGIAPNMLSKIFEMFTQIDTSLERARGGLGIGLTLVKRLVEMHGGSVSALSEGPGRGSEFVVRLPIMLETPKVPQPPEPAVIESTSATLRRILVVDDNLDSATMLAMLLTLTGHETHTAHDGLAAVEAAATFKPDVVLLDIGLPKLNGYEAARKIRQQPLGKGMVLVALTGWGQEEDRRKSREAGFDGHMVKPVELDALMQLLAELRPTPE